MWLLRISLALLLTTAALPALAVGSADQARHVHLQNIAYDPSLLRIFIGDTVTWDNHDGVPHTVSSNAGAPITFNQAMPAGGAAFTLSFPNVLTLGYHCNIHGVMQATIEVYDPATLPNVAITGFETVLEVPGVLKQFEITLENNGNGPAAATDLVLQYYYDGRMTQIASIDVPELDEGEEFVAGASWDTSGKVGDFELLLTYDMQDDIFETSEEDNKVYAISPVLVGGLRATDVRDPIPGDGPGQL